MTPAEARVVQLAREVADAAPKKQGTSVYNAGIRWSLIHELRTALKDLEPQS